LNFIGIIITRTCTFIPDSRVHLLILSEVTPIIVDDMGVVSVISLFWMRNSWIY